MIAFTGDGSTGRRIVRDSATSLKKVALELGGKSPYVVCADANLDKAIPELVSAVFTTTSGQICTAPSRLVVEQSVGAEVAQRLTDAISGIRVGNGFNPESQMGPLSTKEQFEKVARYIEQGRDEARLIAGGELLDQPDTRSGYFVSPAIFSDVDPQSRLAQDEIFGPVLILQEFANDDEAIAVANNTMFGLAAAVFTENVHRAWNLSRAIMAGTVWVNTYNRFYAETEVGGYKTSGIGRMAGIDGLMEFTQTKHINFDSTPPASIAGRFG
jgi:betaine-aldehyde dehydrogenase